MPCELVQAFPFALTLGESDAAKLQYVYRIVGHIYLRQRCTQTRHVRVIILAFYCKSITNNHLIGRSDYGKACEERLMERKLNGGILNNSLTVPLIPNMASQI